MTRTRKSSPAPARAATPAMSTPAPSAARQVTVDQLCISPFNVRSNAEDAQATGALEASIAARGVLFPLIIHDMAPFRGEALPDEPVAAFGVLAGGRRLRAIRRLVAAGTLPADFAIEAVVRDVDPAEITELSLAENLMRRSLRDYEIHAAIARAVGQGATIEEIAGNIGQREDWVRRQLRLGRLVPEIFAAYADGILDGDQAQAFAATEDEELQRAAWAHFAPLRDWDRTAHRIRAWYKIGDGELGRLLRFVGEDAYRAAGGRYELDLFADGSPDQKWARGRVTDEGTLRELAENKLAHIRQDLRRRTGRSDLRFAAEPPQHVHSADLSLAIDAEADGECLYLPEGDVIATLAIDREGAPEYRFWWASRKARREGVREASAEGTPAPAAPPRTHFGHTIAGAEALEKPGTYAQAAREGVKDAHGLTADGLQVLRSLRRELLRGLMISDAMGGGAIGRDYLVWSQLRQALTVVRSEGTGRSSLHDRAADVGARGLVSVGYGAEEAEPAEIVAPHLEETRAHQLWRATLEHVQSLPFMTVADPADAFAAFYFESEKVKNAAAAVLAGIALLRSANVPGWRVATHDRIAELLGADDAVIREMWQPTPAFMALFPKLKRLELAQPHVDPEAFRDWHCQGDQIITGATAGALAEAEGWVHPLLSFGAGAPEAAELPEAAE